MEVALVSYVTTEDEAELLREFRWFGAGGGPSSWVGGNCLVLL